jgi:hypothetical protein
VTIQAAPLAGDLLMLLTAAVLLALLVATVVQVVRRRARAAAWLGSALAAVLVVYGAALVGTGVAAGSRQLNPGDTKCFDDWCAAMVGARRDTATERLLVDVRLENRGRGRAMRSNLARAYVEMPGRAPVAPDDGHGLQAFLQPGEHVDVVLAFASPAGDSGARFVVVEGSGGVGPGTFTIGGDGGLFHASAGWPVAPAT